MKSAILTALVTLTVAVGCGTQQAQEPTPTNKPAAVTPSATAAVPERHYFGQSQIITSGATSLKTTPLRIIVAKNHPADVEPVQVGKGWVYAVVTVRFKNVGEKFYHSQVGMWSELRCQKNAEDNVTGEWLGDMQGNYGKLELDPGRQMTWRVTFTVRRTAKPVSFSYQGPGDHVDTWYVK